MHTTIKEKFLKKCKSSTEGRNLYFHQDNIHVYQKPIWALYTLSQYLHHFLCPRVLFMCRKIIKDYNEGFTLHQINNHWHWNKATISWILNCSTLVEVKSTKAGWGILQPPPPPISHPSKKKVSRLISYVTNGLTKITLTLQAGQVPVCNKLYVHFE